MKKTAGKAAPKAAKKGSQAKSAKAGKQGKPQKAAKPTKKTVAATAANKVVSKKSTIKKALKPLKAVKKATKSIAGTKPVTKSAAKKSIAKKPLKKAAKPVKEVLKKSVAKAAAKTKALPKADKKLQKPVVLVKSVKTKPGKPAEKIEVKKPVPAREKEKEVKTAKAEPVKSPKAEKVKPPRRSKKKKQDDDDEPAIENDPLIEEIIRSTKKRTQQPKKPKIIQTFVNPMASLAVALPAEGTKKSTVPKKEPKGKFELEYVVRTSASILYEFLTSPSGLSEWFADDVNIRDGIFTFFWDGSEQKARLLNFKDEKYVRLQWIDKPEGSYFEFRIEKDELTGDVSLIIVDFADEGSDLETSKRLWDSQVNKLLHVIGSY